LGKWGIFFGTWPQQRKEKFVKYVYFVLDSLSFREKIYHLKKKMPPYINYFLKFRGMFSSFLKIILIILKFE
jgi:hypothetical protein